MEKVTLKDLKNFFEREPSMRDNVKKIIKNALVNELEKRGFPPGIHLDFDFEISKFTRQGDAVVVEVREKLHDAGVLVLEDGEDGEIRLTEVPPEFYIAVGRVKGFEEGEFSVSILKAGKKMVINKRFIKKIEVDGAGRDNMAYLKVYISGEEEPETLFLPSVVAEFLVERFSFRGE